MSRYRAGRTLTLLVVLLMLALPRLCLGQDSADRKTLSQIRSEIKKIEQAHARDREEIKRLTKRVDELESENHQLKASSSQVESQATETSHAVEQLQKKAETGPSGSQFSQGFQQYLGSHTFQVTGAAGADFVFDQQPGALDGLHHETQNTFFFNWEPMVLYRPADWILFEGELEGSFGRAGTGTDLPLADFQLVLNDYMTIVAGLFDQPFGDWYESQSPMWVNRLVSAPLPFGVEAVVPPAEIGIQLRGGAQWGGLGQDADYTIWTGNGPSFSENVLGAALGGPVSVASSQTNGKSFGGRFRFYPLPIEANLGALEVGASTYNAKWLDDNWLNSWGLDFNYYKGSLQARGEWVQSYRQMPGNSVSDNRQGWYLQVGYFLRDFKSHFLPDKVNDAVQRSEALVRYSGVNQHFVALGDLDVNTGIAAGGLQAGLIPNFGLSGSPALFAPHSREVALGFDYWIAPSIVWQNEFDIELPRAGGNFVAADGTTTPVGSVPNDKAFLSQFTIGF